MTTRKDPLTEHGAIEAAARELGGWGRAADVIGKSEKWIRDAANPFLEGRHANTVSLRMAVEMTRAGASAFTDYLIRESGRQVVALPAAAPAGNLYSALGTLGKESGEAMAAIAEMLADGRITPNERVRARAELLDAQAAITGLLRKLDEDQGSFNTGG